MSRRLQRYLVWYLQIWKLSTNSNLKNARCKDRKHIKHSISLSNILLPISLKVECAFPLFFFCKMSLEGIRVAQNIYDMNYTRSLYIFFRVCCDATLSSISCVYGSYNLLSLLKFHIVPCQLGRRRINHHFIAL